MINTILQFLIQPKITLRSDKKQNDGKLYPTCCINKDNRIIEERKLKVMATYFEETIVEFKCIYIIIGKSSRTSKRCKKEQYRIMRGAKLGLDNVI